MHIRCIAEKALQRAREYSTPRTTDILPMHAPNCSPAVDDQGAPRRSSKAQRKKSKLKNPANNPDLAAVAVASKGLVKAEVFLKGYPDIPKTEQAEPFRKGRPRIKPAEEDEIVVTTEDGEQYSEKVCCLFCGTEVD
jgi:hypothetical protein